MFLRATFLACAFATSANAADFKPYENGRFGYEVDLPSDFRTVLIPDNGDGIGLESADGLAKLSVWGNNITEDSFRAEGDLRRKLQTEEGWKFTYEKRGASWASFSGTNADRFIYMREIALCDNAMGNFTIEYPSAEQKRYGPLIERLVKTLKAPARCE